MVEYLSNITGISEGSVHYNFVNTFVLKIDLSCLLTEGQEQLFEYAWELLKRKERDNRVISNY